MTSPQELRPEIVVREGQPVTSSLSVATIFEKNHRDVLRAIQNLEVPEEFNQRNFALVDYKDAKGEMRPMYLITRDGFTILAMGFTGKRAMEFKIKYIEAFNRMEEELRSRKEDYRVSGSKEKAASLLQGDRDLERERIRLEAMRIRTNRAEKLRRMILDFRDRGIFEPEDARRAARDAAKLLSEEVPSCGVSEACGTVSLEEEDPAALAAMRRAVCDVILLFCKGETDLPPDGAALESFLFDRGILPTSRNLEIFFRIYRDVMAISHEIRNRILVEERRNPSFQESLGKAARQFLEGERQ